jgi:hypothetical protein
MAITDPCDPIQAFYTDQARQLFAQVTMGQLVFQAVGYTVGRGGFDDGIHTPTLDPCHIQPVDPSDTTLQDQVYPDAGPVLSLSDIAPFQAIEQPANTTVIFQGNTYLGGYTIDGLESVSDITPGSIVSGLGIPPNTVVENVGSPSDTPGNYSVQINNAATANGTGVNLTFLTSAPVVVYVARLPATPIPSNADYALGEMGVWAEVINVVPQVISGNVSIGSDIVSGIASTANLIDGSTITGPGIQPGTTILNVLDINDIQLSLPATGNVTPASLSVVSPSIPAVGTLFLMALAHFPMKGKTNSDVLVLRVVVNY